MAYVLKLHGVIIGRSDLEERDPSTRVASGAFRKGAGYELVEPIFALRQTGESPDRYRRARDTLSLQLFDDAGSFIDTSRVDIEGTGDAATLWLRVEITDPAFWG